MRYNNLIIGLTVLSSVVTYVYYLCRFLVRVLFSLLFANLLVTGSIARNAERRYVSYSEVDFEVFRPAWATRYTDGGGG